MIDITIDLEIKCDMCEKIIRNHVPVLNDSIDEALNELAELNNFRLDGETATCYECNKKLFEKKELK